MEWNQTNKYVKTLKINVNTTLLKLAVNIEVPSYLDSWMAMLNILNYSSGMDFYANRTHIIKDDLKLKRSINKLDAQSYIIHFYCRGKYFLSFLSFSSIWCHCAMQKVIIIMLQLVGCSINHIIKVRLLPTHACMHTAKIVKLKW